MKCEPPRVSGLNSHSKELKALLLTFIFNPGNGYMFEGIEVPPQDIGVGE